MKTKLELEYDHQKTGLILVLGTIIPMLIGMFTIDNIIMQIGLAVTVLIFLFLLKKVSNNYNNIYQELSKKLK